MISAALLAILAAADTRLLDVSRARSAFTLALSLGHSRVSVLDSTTVVVDYAGAEPFLAPLATASADVHVRESEHEYQIVTESLTVSLQRDPFRIRLKDRSGQLLVEQRFDIAPSGDRHRLVLSEAEWLSASPTFRLSRRGFGMMLEGASWNHAQTKASSLRAIVVCQPAPKQILERFHEIHPLSINPQKWNVGFIDRPLIPEDVPLLQSGLDGLVGELVFRSLSREPALAIDLARFASLPEIERDRTAALAALLPMAYRGPFPLPPAALELRRALEPYFRTYLQEVNDRGFPVIHPLPLQFPADPRAASIRDQFLLGDELLAAPFRSQQDRRSVYLPRGHWTGWRSGKRFAGAQTVDIEAAGPIPELFIKSGSILPWQISDRLQLHYFPRLGAEFFLYDEQSRLTQAHAAPAGDFVRLELNDASGSFEWVVHHLLRPRSVILDGQALPEQMAHSEPGWRYDLAQRSLYIRLPLLRSQDTIVNIDFADPKERFDFE